MLHEGDGWIRWDGMILTVSRLGMRRSAGGDTCRPLAMLGSLPFPMDGGGRPYWQQMDDVEK
jgi:hypothetical protein